MIEQAIAAAWDTYAPEGNRWADLGDEQKSAMLDRAKAVGGPSEAGWISASTVVTGKVSYAVGDLVQIEGQEDFWVKRGKFFYGPIARPPGE